MRQVERPDGTDVGFDEVDAAEGHNVTGQLCSGDHWDGFGVGEQLLEK